MRIDWRKARYGLNQRGLRVRFGIVEVPSPHYPGDSTFERTGPGGASFERSGPGGARFERTGPGNATIVPKTSHN